MSSFVLNQEDADALKKLFAVGPAKFSTVNFVCEHIFDSGCSHVAGHCKFTILNKDHYRMIREAISHMGISLMEANDSLATKVAAAMKDQKPGPKIPTPPKGPQPPKPIGAQNDEPDEEMVDNLAQAAANDPKLKKEIEAAALGETLAQEIILDEIKLGKTIRQGIAEAGRITGLAEDHLIEFNLDDASMQLMELLVALKAQNTKDIPLSKLAKVVDNSSIDLSPSQDMEAFVGLLSGLPVVQSVNPDEDVVSLELPADADAAAGPDQDEREEAALEKTASNQNKKDRKKDKDANADAADDLFASREYNFETLVMENDAEIELLTFEVAESLLDQLHNAGWSGTDDTVLQHFVGTAEKEYPAIDEQLLKDATIDMYAQIYGAAK